MRFMMWETDEYDRLAAFMAARGLEFDVEDEVDTEVIKMWKITQGYRRKDEPVTPQNDFLVAGIILAMREGEYIIDGIAVDAPMRKSGMGKTLLEKAEAEVKKRGGKRVYLVAKAPGFFRKLGYVNLPAEEAPNFFECKSCPQFNVDCFPEVMVHELP